MRLPRFQYLEPMDLHEALEMRAEYGSECETLAGGTDLLVRMKQRLVRPRFLMSLKHLHGLDHVTPEDSRVRIGARTSLATLCHSRLVRDAFPALAEAARSVGSPAIQHVKGTIGGNVCQDTRCLYYNQSPFWRSGRQPCHKAGGQICYAREGSDRCRSTHQSDGASALAALGARAVLAAREGEREIPLEDLFSARGEHPLAIEPRELLTEIRLPLPRRGTGSAYQRLAYRSAIDYPIVSAGALLETAEGEIRKARIVVGAVSNAPLLLASAAEVLTGTAVADRDAFRRAAAVAQDHASAFAVENVGATVDYRNQMISVLVFRAVAQAAARTAENGEQRP